MTGLFREQLGSGPDLVLVHGWGVHGGVWNSLASVLAARFRVTMVDLPGHGRSLGLGPAADLDMYADTLAGVVDGPADWLGWSLGATVLLRMCERYPQHVQRLVLVGATPRFTSAADWPWGMDPEVLDAFSRELRTDYRATLQRFLSLQLGADEAARAPVRRLRTELFRYGEPNHAALDAGLAILRSADLRASLSGIRVACQIIHGAHDRLVAPAAAEFLGARLNASRCDVLAGAGHAPFLSHPRAFETVLDAFLHD